MRLMRHEIAFELMRLLLLTKGAKRRQVQIIFVGLSVHIRKPDLCLVTEACKCFSLVPRRVASRLLKLSQLRGADLQLATPSCPLAGQTRRWRWQRRWGKARKLGMCCLAQPGQTPEQKNTSKSIVRSTKNVPAKAQSGAQNKHQQK